MKPEIITIVGKSNSGKTTLVEKIIRNLTRRGYKIGSVKHAHGGFDMDKEGKDSWRHKKAGAASTLVISPDNIALVKDDPAPSVEKMVQYLDDNDIILAEGFKKLDLPKIEIFRKEGSHKEPLCNGDHNLVAFVTNSEFTMEVPQFGLDDIDRVSDFIESRFINP